MRCLAWNVYQLVEKKKVLIDTVYYLSDMDRESVLRDLVEVDGFPSDIFIEMSGDIDV